MRAYRAAEKALREYRHERAVPVLAVGLQTHGYQAGQAVLLLSNSGQAWR